MDPSAVPSSCPLRRSARFSGASLSMDCGGSSEETADLRRIDPAPGKAPVLLRFPPNAVSSGWVVYAKPAFGGPEQVIRYLGRYTHRVAISNHRLISFDGAPLRFAGEIMLAATSNAIDDGHRRGVHSPVSASRLAESLRAYPALRGLGQLPPSRVHRSVPEILRTWCPWSGHPKAAPSNPSWRCPRCQAPLILILRLTAAQLFWRFSSNGFADSS